MKRIILLFCLFVCYACADSEVPVESLSGELPRSTPEAQGISSAGILALVNEIDRLNQREPGDTETITPEFHSLMILRNGHVIAEGWWQPYGPELNHALFSLSKSFTSTAIGFAVQENLLNLDDQVLSFFPTKRPDDVSENLEAMTIRHLLTMSTGQPSDDRTSEDWVQTFLAIPVESEPGSTFRYSTSATFMLSAILQEVTGETLMEYLTPRLFEPLAIEGVEWLKSPGGYNTGGYGMSATTEDIARLGQFYLQEGNWEGEQLLSKDWIALATSKQIENASDPTNPGNATNDWAQGYGFQFWQTTHQAYRGDGAFGQFCLVIPELNLVVAATAGTPNMQAMLNIFWEHLLPAIEADPQPEDPDALNQLQEKLITLETLQPAASDDAWDPFEASYTLSENPTGLRNVSYQGKANSLTFSMEGQEGTHEVTCGRNEWTLSQISGSILPDNLLSRAIPDTVDAASSCTWVDSQTLQMIWRPIEIPLALAITHTFNDDGVQVERAWYNTSEGANLVLTGRAVETASSE